MTPKGLIASALLLLFCSASVDSFFFGPSTSGGRNWDVFVFVQNWPESVCDKWTNQRGGNTCNKYPKNHWTVHGAWPTQLGTRGPNDCDPSRKFNLAEVGGLERDLDEWWTPIQVNARKTYFWEHEWEKHGTCALPVIETQYQYFKQALDWVRQYEMGEIFRTSGIVPGGDYSFNDITEAIRRVINKTPQVICYYNRNKPSIILEVRICFSQSLQLVDCNNYSNCDRNKMIHYPTPSA
ncbi:unnamed protein product [Nezara viridula]|uniref:Uncharacterized protein n=1 Tax=Nezara viridula TaxID=85310 RepID=A0A9P0H9M8_NEZVI|nr:unnamed protein product [Nezara viridula]